MLLGGGRPCERRDRICELLRCLGGVVAVEDARDLLHLLTERAVRAGCAVGGRATADDTRALCCDELCEFEGDSRLADPGRAEDRDEVTSSLVDDAVPDAGENCKLAIASDHRNGRGRALPDGRRGAESEPRLHGRLLPLCHDRLGRPVLDRAARPDVRLLAYEHRPDRGRGLQSGRGVDDVPRNEGLAALGAGVECDDRLAGVDGDAQLEPFALGPVADGESGAHGPLGVVAVCRPVHRTRPSRHRRRTSRPSRRGSRARRARARSRGRGTHGRPPGRASRSAR